MLKDQLQMAMIPGGAMTQLHHCTRKYEKSSE
jgi:hypothetical protein